MVVLKGLILDYWLIWIYQITAHRIADCHLPVWLCVCTCIDNHTGQILWLIWSMAPSANAIGQHHHFCKCWYHHLLCTTLITWLMPVSSYIAYIFACFFCWCTLSNLDMWHICGIWGTNIFLAYIWDWHGKWKVYFVRFWLIWPHGQRSICHQAVVSSLAFLSPCIVIWQYMLHHWFEQLHMWYVYWHTCSRNCMSSNLCTGLICGIWGAYFIACAYFAIVW